MGNRQSRHAADEDEIDFGSGRRDQGKSCADQEDQARVCPAGREGLGLTQCPIMREYNQRNLIPELSSEKAQGQKMDLSTDRMVSSIPKSKLGDSEEKSNWIYPSPRVGIVQLPLWRGNVLIFR